LKAGLGIERAASKSFPLTSLHQQVQFGSPLDANVAQQDLKINYFGAVQRLQPGKMPAFRRSG
jgi:hypothetical protein